jgi:hypothetical protein
MPDQRLQIRRFAACLHVAQRCTSERRVLGTGIATTFDVLPPLREELLGTDFSRVRVLRSTLTPRYFPRTRHAIRDKAYATKIVGILADHGYTEPVPGGAEVEGRWRREVWRRVSED